MHFARTLRTLVVFGALLGVTRLSATPLDDARAALAGGIEKVSIALHEHPDAENLVIILDNLADETFAFATTTRLAVGRDWRDCSPADQSRMIELFSRLVVRTYAERFRRETAATFDYGSPTQLTATRIEIPTKISTSAGAFEVIYRLELDTTSSPGRWRVYDVIAEGVSLIANYRAQFAPIISKSGAAGLIQSLESKLAEPIVTP